MSRPVVLIVEDEPLVLLNAVSILEATGFDTVEARNADEAIAVLEARKDIRIVFTDIQMPGSMDGLRLAHVIRHRWPPIELVLTSGHDHLEGDIPERGIFLGKPYRAADLTRSIQALLN